MLATSSVVALFIDTMTGSRALIGLAMTIQALLMPIGQIYTAPYVNTIRNLPRFMFKGMGYQRVIPLLMAIPLFLGMGEMTVVVIFLILFSAFWLWDGTLSMVWIELAARALKPDLRGHMMGMQLIIGGVISLLTGLLLAWLLATPLLTEHNRYGTIFVISSVLLLTSLIFIRMVKDPSPVTDPEKPTLRSYYAGIWDLLRNNAPLQHAIIARLPGFIGFAAITFVIVFGTDTLDITHAQVSGLVYSQIAGSIAGGFLLGETSRRIGNKAVIIMSNVGVVITLSMAVALAYFPALGYIWLLSLCAFASFWYNNWLGYLNYYVDIAPENKRPDYQIIGNAIGIPFSFAALVMGAIIDELGFVVVFAAAGAFAIAAIPLSFRLLSKKRLQELKNSREQ